MSNASIGFPATLPPTTTSNKHKKIASADNIGFPSALTGLPFQPLPASLQAYTFDVKSNYDGSSRSTSGYSLMPDSAGPLLNKGSFGQAYPGSQAETTNKYTMRFRSDQFDKLIKAIKPETEQQQQQQYPDSRTAMPPPPLPAHAVGSKDNGVSAQPLLPPNEAVDAAFGSEVEFIDRRAESRYSDVSMHAGCNGFPTCTTEDADGRIVHNTNATNCTPAAPAPVVRGRKEGSSPTKRKLSHSAKKGDMEKAKKLRRSTRLSQHDSGYSGASSGNSDEHGGAADAPVQGTGNGAAIVESSGSAGQEAD